MKSKIRAFNNSNHYIMRKRNLLIAALAVFCSLFFSTQIKAQCFAPSVQASNVQVTYKSSGGTGATISWNRGSGDYCLVTIRPSSTSYYGPPSSTGTNYAASGTYGNGSNLGGSTFVVYDGTGTSVYVSGLQPNTLYYAYVYEYNSCTIFSTTYYYNTSTSGNNEGFSTLEAQPSSCSSITSVTSITNSGATINFAPGGGSGRYIFMGPNSTSPGSYPQDGYYYSFSTTYGAGNNFGNSYYGMYNNSGTSVAVTGLVGATTYRVYDYEYTNGTYPTWSTFDYNTKNYTSCGTYTFNTTNVPPTLNAISNYTVCQDVSWQSVPLSGIGDGSTNENQNISFSYSSSNTTLIPNGNLTISYASPNTTGTFYYYPAAGQSGTSILTVTANDGWTVNNTFSRTFTVTVLPKPAAAGAISGNSPICAGGGLQSYSIAPVAYATAYTWAMPAGFTVTVGGGTNNITVNTTSLTTSGTLTVTPTNTNGCGNGTSNTRSITVDQQPANPYAGPDAPVVCTNAYFTNATAPVGPDGGVWSWLPGPSAVIGNTTSNQTSINPLNGSPTPNTYKLLWTVTRAGSVCPSKKDTLVLTADFNNVACTPVSNFQYGPSSDVSSNKVCVNTSINFQDLSVSADTWLWDFEYTGSVGPHTSNVQNPSYTYTTTGTYTVYLKIHSNTTSLDYTSTQTLTVIGAPATPGAISGNAGPICQAAAGQYNYSISSVTDATGYAWSTPTGIIIDSYPGPTSIATSYSTNATSGNIQVTASNSCGTSSASTLSITVSPLPASMGSVISGNTSVCEGTSNEVYGIGGYANATNYTWTDLGGTQTVGTASYTMNIPMGAMSGTISVMGTNTCGNGDVVILPITVNPLPVAAQPVSGMMSVNICPNPGNILFTVPVIGNANTYNWTIPSGTSISGGNGKDSIMISIGSGVTGGTNTVSVFGSNGCGNGASNSTTIEINTPEGPQICMVTVDDSSTHNIVMWDKSPILHADSFRIYREDVTNVYTQIGTVHYNSLSEFHDYDSVANPNVTTKRYKISSIDSCGNESVLSNYHNTIYITDNGLGQFTWAQLYTIENGPNPVNNYELWVDSMNNGDWALRASTAGTQQVINDIYYTNYASVANWRVETVWGISCDPTLRIGGGNGTQAAIVKSKSNISNNRQTTGITNSLAGKLNLYPNPTSGIFTLNLSGTQGKTTVKVTSLLGQEIFSENFSNANGRHTLDLSSYEAGTYVVQVITSNGLLTQRVIKQ